MIPENNTDNENNENSPKEPVEPPASDRHEKKEMKKTNLFSVLKDISILQVMESLILIIGIILIAMASFNVGRIAGVKFNDFTDIAFPLSFIFIVSPLVLYFKRLRTRNIFLSVIILLIIGIVLLYYLIFPYKMFVIHFDLL